MKKIKFMDTSFRDGLQSCLGARVKADDFIPALEAALDAGTDNFEIGGGARFQSLYFYCQEDAFDMMDQCRQVVGKDINLQTLARGANVVGLISQSRDVIDLHAKLFKKHGITTIRNFDALNDVRNLAYSGKCIVDAGLKHQVVVTMMGLAPGIESKGAHSPEFYISKLQDILNADVPFDSVAFKDASGTSTPKTVYETIKAARKLLPENVEIEFHTHDTAGMAVACNFAAITAGADIIDLSMAPCSGGTAQADVLTMWQRLRGTDYALDIDPEKILEAERIFAEQMDKYFIPPEAKEVSPIITFSPMPGGALTANTQMMRDNNSLDLYPEVIKNMREVVERGGFGTSVTPVSQFYFQQAFMNTVNIKNGLDKWAKMTDGYGKMLLGYFGKTPVEPDSELVKIAADQLGLSPTTEDVHDINDKNPELGLDVAKKKLEDNSLELTDENIFITATCGDKGIQYLKGNAPCGIRYKADVEKSTQKSSGVYDVEVNGKTYSVQVTDSDTVITPTSDSVKVKNGAAVETESSGEGYEVLAPMEGPVISVEVEVGDEVEAGDTVILIESMKMEIPVKTEHSGIVKEVYVDKGQQVTATKPLVLIGG
jgi:pyruvate carboxylase subunit B